MLNRKSLALTPLALLAFTGTLWAAPAKTYQVTGPIVSTTDSTITVKKGKDNWEIGRDGSTKVTGELKEGAKVTVQYRMSATEIEVKSATAAKSTKSSKKK
jgi:uncharacterized beta-barrel protein YwiB (DUF1934 family)